MNLHLQYSSYHTRSNAQRVLKTPGGKLTYQTVKKRANGPKCGKTGVSLPGVRRMPSHSHHDHHDDTGACAAPVVRRNLFLPVAWLTHDDVALPLPPPPPV